MKTYTAEERLRLIRKNYGKSIADSPLFLEWNWEKNGDFIIPEMFALSSKEKIWWKCKNGHEWQDIIDNRNQGQGCPYCK